MADRYALAGELVTARSMELATMPTLEDEPPGMSTWWPAGISATLWKAHFTRDLRARRDLIVLAGARLMGWLEALDSELENAGVSH